jgi:hypothetical protein
MSIENQADYASVSIKYLLLDNLHLIIPQIQHDTKRLQACFKSILKLILTVKVHVAQVNMNVLFNDKSIFGDLLVAFLNCLIEESDAVEQDAHLTKFLNKLVALAKNEEYYFFLKLLSVLDVDSTLLKHRLQIMDYLFKIKKTSKSILNVQQKALFFAVIF